MLNSAVPYEFAHFQNTTCLPKLWVHHLGSTNLAFVVTGSYDVQKWIREQNADHDGLVHAEEVAKFMLLHTRTVRNKYGKVLAPAEVGTETSA